MIRTYIKLNLQVVGNEHKPGGLYLDSIAAVAEWSESRTVLSMNGGHYCSIINKPLAEVEDMLLEANLKKPRELNWRDISGKPPKPEKAPKKGLAARFSR